MARTNLKDLADRLIPGGLEAWLRQGKTAEGKSLYQLARDLESDHDINVTDETVRGWCQSYGIPTNRPGAEVAS